MFRRSRFEIRPRSADVNERPESAQQIVDAKEETDPNGRRILRVVATGTVSNAPVQWIYYHVTNAQGERLSCVFTMGGEDSEAFGFTDLEMINSLRFLPTEES